jgi:hypothetical protein
MSGVVSVDVEQSKPVQVIEVEADASTIDVTLPAPPVIEVDLPDPLPPTSVDVIAAPPPTVSVDAVVPPPPLVAVTLPAPVTVDVVGGAPQPPVQIDVLAAWQTGIPDAPNDGNIYGRRGGIDWVEVLSDTTPYAPLDSPAFFGTPTAPTAPPNTTTTQLATTQYVEAAVVAGQRPDLVTSVAHKTGDVLLYTDDIEDFDVQQIDGGSF